MTGKIQVGLAGLIAIVAASLLISAAHAPPADAVQLAVAGPAPVVVTTATVAPVVTPKPPHSDPEQRLIAILDDIRHGQLDRAEYQVQDLIEDKPNFRLAQLVYGDLLASRAGVPVAFETRRDQVESLMAEARQRWRHYRSQESKEYLPESLLQLADSQEHAVVVDLSSSRMFVFRNENGRPVLVSDHYVSGGKNGAHKQVQGDRKTPVGVYFVVDRLPGEDLPDKYGPVAFPVDYPNEWDQRLGRTGSGIWLHGVASNTYSRPPLDSDGCVALTNEELEIIAPLMREGSTPVVIGEAIEWVSHEQIMNRRQAVNAAIEQWRSDWESGEVERYLSHYSDEFHGRGMGKRDWDDYKTRVTRSKKYIEVELGDLSVFEHPHEQDMVIVTFDQQYDSDSFSSEARKRQYWRAEADGRWRIISEESV
ncbi:MAG: L,D-transpeptidase family protein [Gammaproteobacteria bacterium]|nr:L,D-transpeptidase family protein [Gammaproteobacteria bacterium]